MESIARARRWGPAAALLALGLAALAVGYGPTLRSFYVVWRQSDTYTHCFFVLPIVAVLVWRRRHDLRRTSPEPFWPGLVLIAGAGAPLSQTASPLWYFSSQSMRPM